MDAFVAVSGLPLCAAPLVGLRIGVGFAVISLSNGHRQGLWLGTDGGDGGGVEPGFSGRLQIVQSRNQLPSADAADQRRGSEEHGSAKFVRLLTNLQS